MAIQPVSVIPVVCPYSQSVAWVRAEAKKMVSGPSKATIAASPSGKARMDVSLVPRPRARTKGAGVGVASAGAGVKSGVEPGVAVDEGALECVATTEGCTVGITIALSVAVA